MAQMDGEGKSEFGKSEPDKKGMGAELHHLEIHPTENHGHVVEHHFKEKPNRSGAFITRSEPTKHSFGADEHAKMLSHVAQHLGIENADRENHDGENAE